MADRGPRTPFRLVLDEQTTRAEALLGAAKAGDPTALARLGSDNPRGLTLADAQRAIAHALRTANWSSLKAHIAALAHQRAAIAARAPALDADQATLHIRCGSDIAPALREAGFAGDFLEHATPYCLGPVIAGPERHEEMARFLVAAFPDAQGGLTYDRALADLIGGEARLRCSADDYDRVVLWMEHDSWDQLVLVRLLAHYATAPRPRALELIAVDDFPGDARFIGLGQLPAEALRLLWSTRQPVTASQLALGAGAWGALTSDDPRRLAALARSGTPMLPILAPALHRHLRELPALDTGLGLTQRLVLELLAEGDRTAGRVFEALTAAREPLPWLGDLGLRYVIDMMLAPAEPVMVATPPAPDAPWHRRHLAITPLGRAVLEGARDWMSLAPPPRWVGGIRIAPDAPGWRWDDARREAVLT